MKMTPNPLFDNLYTITFSYSIRISIVNMRLFQTPHTKLQFLPRTKKMKREERL